VTPRRPHDARQQIEIRSAMAPRQVAGNGAPFMAIARAIPVRRLRDLTGTRWNGTGIATREIDCKTAPHLGFDPLNLAIDVAQFGIRTA
jgi:hypothetical protein